MPYQDALTQNISSEFIASLPIEIQVLLKDVLYKIYKRDDFTHALVIQCQSRDKALDLTAYRQKIYSTLSKIVKTPVEGAIVYCAGDNCSDYCAKLLGCVCSMVKAY